MINVLVCGRLWEGNWEKLPWNVKHELWPDVTKSWNWKYFSDEEVRNALVEKDLLGTPLDMGGSINLDIIKTMDKFMSRKQQIDVIDAAGDRKAIYRMLYPDPDVYHPDEYHKEKMAVLNYFENKKTHPKTIYDVSIFYDLVLPKLKELEVDEITDRLI